MKDETPSTAEIPPLRAHDYRRRDPKLRMAAATLRPKRGRIGQPEPPSRDPDDDYTPWRDESGGRYA